MAGRIDLPTIIQRVIIDTKGMEEGQRKATKAGDDLNRSLNKQQKEADSTSRAHDDLGRSVRGTAMGFTEEKDSVDKSSDSHRRHRRDVDTDTNALSKLIAESKKVKTGDVIGRVVGMMKVPAIVGAVDLLIGSVNALGAATFTLGGQLAPLVGVGGAIPGLGLAAIGSLVGIKQLVGGAGEAASAVAKYGASSTQAKKALEALSPSARQFAIELGTLRKSFDDIKNAGQAVALPKFADALKTMRPLFPILKSGFVGLSSALGDVAKQAAVTFSTQSFKTDLSKILTNNTQLVKTLGSAIGPIGVALTKVMIAAAPMTQLFADWIANSAQALAVWTGGNADKMQAFFDNAGKKVGQVVDGLKDFGIGLKNISQIANQSLGIDFIKNIETGGAKLKRFTESTKGQNSIAKYFKDSQPALHEFNLLLEDIFKSFLILGTGPGLVNTLTKIRRELLPAFIELTTGVTQNLGPALVNLGTGFLKFSNMLSFSPIVAFVGALGALAAAIADLISSVPGLSTVVATFITLGIALKGIEFAAAKTGILNIINAMTMAGPVNAKYLTGISGLLVGFRGLPAVAKGAAAATSAVGTEAVVAGAAAGGLSYKLGLMFSPVYAKGAGILSGAIRGLGGGLSALSIGLGGLTAKMKTFSVTTGAATGKMGLGTVATKTWIGALIAAAGYMAYFVMQSDKLYESVIKTNAALKENPLDKDAYKDASDSLAALQKQYDTIMRPTNSPLGRIKQFFAMAGEGSNAILNFDWDMSESTFNKYKEANTEFQRITQDTQHAVFMAAAQVGVSWEEMAKHAQDAGVILDGTVDQNIAKLIKFGAIEFEPNASLAEFATAVLKMGDATATATTKTDAFRTALAALNDYLNPKAGAAAAVATAAQELANFSTNYDGAVVSIQNGLPVLDATNAKNANLILGFQTMAGSLQNVAVETYKQTGSVDAASAAYKKQYDILINQTAAALKITTTQAKALVDQYLLTPEEITTNINTPGLSAAITQFGDVQKAMQWLQDHPQIKVTVTAYADFSRVAAAFHALPTNPMGLGGQGSIDYSMSTGAVIRQASGGYISGPGTGTSDSIPALLSNGEYVINAESVRKIGLTFLDILNNGKIKVLKKMTGGLASGGSGGTAPWTSLTNVQGPVATVRVVLDYSEMPSWMKTAPDPTKSSLYRSQVGGAAPTFTYTPTIVKTLTNVASTSKTTATNTSNTAKATTKAAIATAEQTAAQKKAAEAAKKAAAEAEKKAKEIAAAILKLHNDLTVGYTVPIDEVNATIKEITGNAKVSGFTSAGATAQSTYLQSVMKNITASQKKLLDAASAKLNELLSAAADAQRQISGAMQGFGSITNAFADVVSDLPSIVSTVTGETVQRPVVPVEILQALQKRDDTLKSFLADIVSLRNRGLNAQSLQEIINAGPDSGGRLAAILREATPEQIAAINAVQAEIKSLSESIGQEGAFAEYGEKITQAQQEANELLQKILDAIKERAATVGVGTASPNYSPTPLAPAPEPTVAEAEKYEGMDRVWNGFIWTYKSKTYSEKPLVDQIPPLSGYDRVWNGYQWTYVRNNAVPLPSGATEPPASVPRTGPATPATAPTTSTTPTTSSLPPMPAAVAGFDRVWNGTAWTYVPNTATTTQGYSATPNWATIPAAVAGYDRVWNGYTWTLVPHVAQGGYIKSLMSMVKQVPTGLVKGPGTATSDSVLAALSNGEYVIKASTVKQLGVPFLNKLNAGKLQARAMGGLVSTIDRTPIATMATTRDQDMVRLHPESVRALGIEVAERLMAAERARTGSEPLELGGQTIDALGRVIQSGVRVGVDSRLTDVVNGRRSFG